MNVLANVEWDKVYVLINGIAGDGCFVVEVKVESRFPSLLGVVMAILLIVE